MHTDRAFMGLNTCLFPLPILDFSLIPKVLETYLVSDLVFCCSHEYAIEKTFLSEMPFKQSFSKVVRAQEIDFF